MILNFRRAVIPTLLGSLLISAPGLAPAAQDNILLPDMGDTSDSVITPLQEKELGQAFFRDLHRRIKISYDPEISEFIQNLGERLVVASDRPELPFHFFVVSEPVINAFAGPGGYIGINAGLILAAESESEVASVMAHEITHVTQRHLFRAFEAAGRMSIPLAAATIAAILIGTQSAELGQAALIAAQATGTQYQINFTRDNEQEADRIGMKLLAKSEFDPRGMPSFFERLQKASRYYKNGPPEFLRTHPVTVSRIADTRGRAEQYPYKQHLDSPNYLLFKAKIRVQTGEDPEEAVKYFKTKLDQGTSIQQATAHYGLALALIINKKPDAAKPILQQLVQEYPQQPWFINALAQAELAANNLPAALTLYTQASQRFPESRSLTFEYAKALIRVGQPEAEKARTLLLQYQQKHNEDAETYYRLAQAYGKLKQQAEAHRYLAEYYFVTGRPHTAVIQAKIALKASKGNFYLTTVLEDRLKYYKIEEKARKKREKI